MFDLTWVLSIFKFSRTCGATGSDAHRNFRLRGNYFRYRNVKSRRDTTFSIPNFNLASTSESILKAGLHKVWRTTGKSRPSEPRSQVPTGPLQREKQPEPPYPKASQHGDISQPPILTHLPFPQTGQPQPCVSADPQHPSRSRFFHLHKTVNKKPDSEQIIVRPSKLETTSRASASPQPTAVPNRLPIVSFGSSAVKGLESTQQNVGFSIFTAGPYPFYSSESSLSSFQVTFLPNTFSPSQSLLFLPPTPPPKRNNLEEDTVPLPAASEPNLKNNQFVTTCPVRNSDQEFSINTLPSPSLPTDQTVSRSSMFPKQSSNTLSLSPLPIVMSFSPGPLAGPPPPELVIKIAGPEGYLNADHHRSQITHFLSSRATEFSNSLVIIWQLSHIDGGGRKGLNSLKTLFAQLDEKVLDSDRTSLSKFTKLSITIPDQVKDVAPYNNLPQPIEEDDRIDLANAMDLHEFAWHGDFVIFATKFKNLSLVTLTSLNIKTSNIRIEDAITLLHSCSVLQKVSLGTIRSEEDSDTFISMRSSGHGGVERKALPNLTFLALESDVALHPLIRRFCWTTQVSLSLTLRKQGTTSLVQALDSGSQ